MSLSKFAPNEQFAKKPKKRTYDLSVDDEFVTTMHQEQANKNSKRGERSAEKAFVDYLKAVDAQDFQFWDFEAEFLDGLLSKFWFAVRQTENDEETGLPKRYKVQSLRTLRYSLNRSLKDRGKKHNIITGEKFAASQIAFEDACKELKSKGYGYVKPTDEITPLG